MNDSATVLVTGGSGFVGSYVIAALLAAGAVGAGWWEQNHYLERRYENTSPRLRLAEALRWARDLRDARVAVAGVRGVRLRRKGQTQEVGANAVVLAAGGFQANTEWRTRYLGPNWDLAKVRGTRFNVGDGIRMALEIGASPRGNWSGCHAVGWERNAPEFGDLAVASQDDRCRVARCGDGTLGGAH